MEMDAVRNNRLAKILAIVAIVCFVCCLAGSCSSGGGQSSGAQPQSQETAQSTGTGFGDEVGDAPASPNRQDSSSSAGRTDTPSSADAIASDRGDGGQHGSQTDSPQSGGQSGTTEPSGLPKTGSVAGFEALSQFPELPNGCEITSLAAVLDFYGYDVDKTTLSDVYLPKAPVGQANFYVEFVGDPRDDDAYGCYAPVIVATANSYLESVGSSSRAKNLTGATPDELYARVDQGQPVIVWATRYLEAGYYSVTWNVDGQSMTWYTPEHCMVLVGYDKDNGTVSLADPMEGSVVKYDMDLFEQRYGELKNQAVVIE